MKHKEIRELHQKGRLELGKMLTEAQEKVQKMRMESRTQKVKNVRQIGRLKDDIARIMTVVRQKELEEALKNETV